jgi:outer membrane protein TolC
MLAREQPEEMTAPDCGALASAALRDRPDIRGAILAVRAAEADLGSARSAYYPSLSLQGALDADRSDDPGMDSGDVSGSVSLVLGYPLFQGFQNQAGVAEKKAARTEAEKALQGLETEVVAGVRSGCTRVLSAQRQLELLRTNAELARQSRDLVEQEYLAGTTSLVRLNEAQKELTTTQSRLALGLATLRQAWYSLRAEAGTL